MSDRPPLEEQRKCQECGGPEFGVVHSLRFKGATAHVFKWGPQPEGYIDGVVIETLTDGTVIIYMPNGEEVHGNAFDDPSEKSAFADRLITACQERSNWS